MDARISLCQDPYNGLRKARYEVTYASLRLARTVYHSPQLKPQRPTMRCRLLLAGLPPNRYSQ